MNRYYSPKILRNFQVEDFLKPTIKKFFETPAKFNKAWLESNETNGWSKASDLIQNNEMFVGDEKLSSIEKMFYEELFDNVPDTAFVFPLVFMDSEIHSIIEKIKNLIPNGGRINQTFENLEEFHLINSTFDNNIVKLLFRHGYTRDEDNKQVVFTISCIINLDDHYLQIKYKKDFRKKSVHKNADILNSVIEYIHNLNVVTVNTFNPAYIKSVFFNMFKDESERADQLIKNQAGIHEFDAKFNEAKEFLETSFGITEFESEFYDKYIYRLMSIPYHQFALSMTDANFGDRFMFAFSFYDGNTTRSTTRNSDKNHVYTGNLYWVLKDLIVEKELLSSISMYYRFNQTDFSIIGGENNLSVEVNFKECTSLGRESGCIWIEFLQPNKKRRDPKRGIKNEFIMHEIKRYFPFASQL